jgi:uncharacterized protein YdaU (DUF1376 family)
MTAEEFGVYWRLVCHSWNKGGLPNDDKRLALMAGQCSGNAVAYAKTKFDVGPDGLLRNARLEKVRAEQQNYSKMQSDKAHLRWDAQHLKKNGSPNHDAGALPVHVPKLCSPPPTPTPITNREREEKFPEANIPTWEEVKTMAAMTNIAEETARAFFEHYDSKNLWRNKHGYLINVKGSLVVWNNNDRKMENNGTKPNGNTARASSVFEMKTIMETKEKLAAALKNKFATEGPLSTDWSDQSKRAEWVKLRAEIKALQQQIGSKPVLVAA